MIVAKYLGIDRSLLDELSATYYFKITLDQSLLLTLENQSKWAIKNKLTDQTEVPNYLDFVYLDAMADLEVDSRKVIITLEREDEKSVKIAIRDFGIGIDENKINRIFESFYTTKREGIGLGLSISKSIIEAHGGQFWAQNNPDEGTTFYFTLPIHEEA